MNEIAPYRIKSINNPNKLILEIENASVSEDFIDEVSNKNFYIRFKKQKGEPSLSIVIMSKYPIPFKNMIEEKNNLVLNLMPSITSINWTDNNLLQIKSNGELNNPEIFYLQDPKRMVIDIPSLRFSDFDLDIKENKFIRDVRVSQFKYDPMTVRIVFEIKDDKYLKLKSNTSKELLEVEPVNRTQVLDLKCNNNLISFKSDRRIKPDIFTLEKPSRLVIDLHNTDIKSNFPEKIKELA